MTYEPSGVMVEAAAGVFDSLVPTVFSAEAFKEPARAALKAAFAAAIESGEAREEQSGWLNYENNQFYKTPALILRMGDKP